MRALTYIRLATYAMFLVAAFLVYRGARVQVIPAQLWGDDDQEKFELRQWQRETDERTTKVLGTLPWRENFRNTRMSGSQVLAVAIAALKNAGIDPKDFRQPEVLLREEKGKLVWDVYFYPFKFADSGFHDVEVDDQTGQTELAMTM